MKAINLAQKLATFSEHFKPRTVGVFNGPDLMVGKLNGPFHWEVHTGDAATAARRVVI